MASLSVSHLVPRSPFAHSLARHHNRKPPQVTARLEAGLKRIGCWAEADAALAELGHLDDRLKTLDAQRQEAAEEAEREAEAACAAMRARHGRLTAALERFCRGHQPELERRNGHGRRSRRLFFGRLGYRVSQAVVIRDEAAALRALAGWRPGQGFLRSHVELDREALRDYLFTARNRRGSSQRQLRSRLGRAGIRLERSDNWFYEVNQKTLRQWGNAGWTEGGRKRSR